jgi:hypothetical protein
LHVVAQVTDGTEFTAWGSLNLVHCTHDKETQPIPPPQARAR